MNKYKLKINRAFKSFAAIVLLGVILISTTNATTILGTVNIQNHNNSLSDMGKLWGGGLSGGTYFTGIYSWTNMGGTLLGPLVPNWGFCIELPQSPYNGWQDVIYLEEAPLPAMYGTPMGVTKTDFIRELWGRHFDANWVTNPTTANKRLAEAFGACLWEIVYETSTTWDITSGIGFHASNIEQVATANTWLGGLTGDKTYFEKKLVATCTPCGQDYLVLLPQEPPPVPEPATVALLVFGMSGIIRFKRR